MSKQTLEAKIKEAQTNISWAEHKGQHEERKIWVAKLRELKQIKKDS